MAKNVDEAKAVDIAGKEPGVTPAPTRIQSQEDALKLIYELGMSPGLNDVLYVTEDRNVFEADKYDFAANHAHKQKLKIFEIR